MNAHQKAWARVNAFVAGSSPEDDDLREGLTNLGKPVTQKKPLDVWAKRRERWKGFTKKKVSAGDKKWAEHMKTVTVKEDELLERSELRQHRVRVKESISEAFKMTYEKGSWEPGHHHILHTQLHSPDLETAKTGEAIGHSVRQHPHHQALVKAGWRVHTYGAHKKGAFAHTIHTAEEVAEIDESKIAGVLSAMSAAKLSEGKNPFGKKGDKEDAGAPPKNDNPFAKKGASANTANTANDKQVKDDKKPTIKIGTKETVDMTPTLREGGWDVIGGRLVRESPEPSWTKEGNWSKSMKRAQDRAVSAERVQSTVATPPDRHIYTDDRSWHMATGDHHLNQAAHHHGKANDPVNTSAFSRARHSEKHDTHLAASRYHYRMAGLMREELEVIISEAKDDYQGDPTKPFGSRAVHMDANSALKHHGWSKMAGSNKAWVRGSNSDRITHLGSGKYRHNYSTPYSYHGGNKEKEVHDTGKGEMFAYLKSYHDKKS